MNENKLTIEKGSFWNDSRSSDRPKLLYYISDHGACYYYRVLLPCIYLSQISKTVHAKLTDMIGDQDLENADIVAFHRAYLPQVVEVAKRAKSLGKKIFLDFDDNVFDVPTKNPAYKTFKEHRKVFTWFIENADLVTVTTEYLANLYKEKTRISNIIVAPNLIFPEHYKAKRSSFKVKFDTDTTKKPGITRIGWGGSHTHEDDLNLIYSAVKEIIETRDDVEFIFFGYISPMFLDLGRSAKFKDGSSRIKLMDVCSIEQYPVVLRMLDLDIGLAPLVDNVFNRCKSNIKFLEYTSVNALSILSDVGPYSSVPSNCAKLVQGKHKYWLRALNEAIDEKQNNLIMKERAKKFVDENYSLMKGGHVWIKVIENVLGNKNTSSSEKVLKEI